MNRLLALSLLMVAAANSAVAADALQCPLPVEASTLATIDTGGDDYPNALVEMRIRPDGRPLIVYTGGPSNAQTARVINCHDSRCGSFDDTLLSSTYNYLDALGLGLANDGRPLILYSHFGRLTYVECGDERCSTSRPVQIEPVNPGFLRTLLVRPDGRPELIYSKGSSSDAPYDIVRYRCDDASCSSGNKQTLVEVDASSSLTMGATASYDSQGRLVMSYLHNNGNFYNTDFKLLQCSDPGCTTLQTRTVSAEPGYRNALVAWSHLLADDGPLLLDDRSDTAAGRSLLIECADGGCTDAISTPLFSNPGRHLVGIRTHDLDRPLMGTLSQTSAGFYVCADADCSDFQLMETPATQPFFNSASLQLSAQMNPMLAYFEATGTQLRLLQCASTVVFRNGFD